jgi:hypothetical protein
MSVAPSYGQPTQFRHYFPVRSILVSVGGHGRLLEGCDEVTQAPIFYFCTGCSCCRGLNSSGDGIYWSTSSSLVEKVSV